MKFLFVDTETSGLSPQKGQIIEIAGVIARLDPVSLQLEIVSEFESLIALRSGVLEERITRITGLTQDDLSKAKPIHKVQDAWANWLEKYGLEGVFVTGHSIDFDYAFLKSEGWFLPARHKTIDTLEMSKILLPQSTAINLEYLTAQYGLSPQHKDRQNHANLTAHRALYDTLGCLYLFQYLIHLVRDLPASHEFYTALTTFFNLPITFYSDNNLHNFSTPRDSGSQIHLRKIHFDGNPIPLSLQQKFNSLTSESLHLANHLLTLSLPRRFQLITLQFYVLILTKLTRPGTVKFHGRDQIDFTFLDTLLSAVLENKEQTGENYILEPYESIIFQIKSLSEHTHRIGKLITYLDIYSALKPGNPTIQKVISSYDFLVIAVQPFWKRSIYVYKPFDLPPEQQMIRAKLDQFCTQLKYLYALTWNEDSVILKSLVAAIRNLLNVLTAEDGNTLTFSSNQELIFRYHSNQVSIGITNKSFRLNTSLTTLIRVRRPTIKTYYSKSDFWKFLEITGTRRVLENYSPIEYGQDPEFILHTSETSLSKFYIERLQVAKENDKPVLILCGQNSGLRDSERILPKIPQIDSKDYLILGDTGSLTKIASKVSQGFGGCVIVKVNDFDYFARLGLIDYSEIWILCSPYLSIHPYWYQLAKRSGNKEEFLKIFKFMYLKSIASKIYNKTQSAVLFQKGYST